MEDGGARLPGRLERGDIDVAIMPAGEDRFSRPPALSDARPGRAAAGPPPEPPCGARRDGACRRTAAAPHSKLRVAWLVRGRLPGCAHSAARAARKRRATDADRIGPGRPRYCRGSLSGADSAQRVFASRWWCIAACRSADGRSLPGIRSASWRPMPCNSSKSWSPIAGAAIRAVNTFGVRRCYLSQVLGRTSALGQRTKPLAR